MHFLRGLPDAANALLIECRAPNASELQKKLEQTIAVVNKASLTLNKAEFSFDPTVCAGFWDARRALIPMVGAVREKGTSVLLEDVAVPVQNLAKLCKGIDEMFVKYGYHDGSAFGHALEGNLHIVMTQSFDTPEMMAQF